jgi:O-antigen ligase
MVLLVPLLLIVINPRFIDIIYGRIFGTFVEGSHPYASASVRIDAMRSAWSVFAEQPLLGVGYASFRLFCAEGFITPESYYLEILADLGLFGAFAFCGLAIYPIWRGWRLSGEAREIYLAAGLSPVVALLASSVSGNNLFDPSLMMLFLVFLAFGISQRLPGMPQQMARFGRAPARCLVGPSSESFVAQRS